MEPILRLFNGAYIDLDKLVQISPIMVEGEHFVIRMEFLLRDHPLEIVVKKLIKNFDRDTREFFIDGYNSRFEGNIDNQHELIIKAWRDFTENKLKAFAGIKTNKPCKKKCSVSAN